MMDRYRDYPPRWLAPSCSDHRTYSDLEPLRCCQAPQLTAACGCQMVVNQLVTSESDSVNRAEALAAGGLDVGQRGGGTRRVKCALVSLCGRGDCLDSGWVLVMCM